MICCIVLNEVLTHPKTDHLGQRSDKVVYEICFSLVHISVGFSGAVSQLI